MTSNSSITRVSVLAPSDFVHPKLVHLKPECRTFMSPKSSWWRIGVNFGLVTQQLPRQLFLWTRKTSQACLYPVPIPDIWTQEISLFEEKRCPFFTLKVVRSLWGPRDTRQKVVHSKSQQTSIGLVFKEGSGRYERLILELIDNRRSPSCAAVPYHRAWRPSVSCIFCELRELITYNCAEWSLSDDD